MYMYIFTYIWDGDSQFLRKRKYGGLWMAASFYRFAFPYKFTRCGLLKKRFMCMSVTWIEDFKMVEE
jgi:hypothetical protein